MTPCTCIGAHKAVAVDSCAVCALPLQAVCYPQCDAMFFDVPLLSSGDTCRTFPAREEDLEDKETFA
eukprot:5106550-Amphidinium_carterae.1